VAVRYGRGTVKLLWARPNAGYEVFVVSDGSRLVDVRFADRRHRSIVRAFWEDGAPANRVEESSRDRDVRTQNWQNWADWRRDG
jgi:hypothetical protein